jgi:serine/threonine protein kinase
MIAPASRHLGKYEIVRKLGRGGMADVYLAQDTELGSAVALKLIEHSADQDTRDSIEAERRGADLQAHLAAIDPRVVKVYDCGDLDGFFFVAMEYIDGQDLSERMHQGPLAVNFTTDVGIAVAETLDHAHNLQVAIDGKNFCGIVHGDIKPKNIRIDTHGAVRVLDFGIAKALSLSRKLTHNEFGSVPYASPERLDLGEVNVQSDLWSLGVMLYEMTTGLQPYHAESTERLERMIRSRIAPPPAPDPCPEALRRILIKAMAPDAGARYQTAREFGDDLIAFRKGEPVRAALEDLDATRRTFHAGDETRRSIHAGGATNTSSAAGTEETRRTAPARSGPPPQAPKVPPAAKPRKPFSAAMKVIGALALASVLYGVWAGFSNYLMYQHGQALKSDIESEQVTDPAEIFAKWTELSKSNPSSLLLYGPRKTVKQKLVDAADRVIAASRGDAQPVYEKDWDRARVFLADALKVDPDDSVRGKLRLCEGQIARINGTTHRDAKTLQEAVDDFTEAQRLLPKSPDPLLGLARVYVYGLKDIDKASDAFQQAAKRGYQIGAREKLYLADGYAARADLLFVDSSAMRGLPQERDQIQRAANDYKEALDLYQSIMPYPRAASGIARVQASLDGANFRLKEIDAGQGQVQAPTVPH